YLGKIAFLAKFPAPICDSLRDGSAHSEHQSPRYHLESAKFLVHILAMPATSRCLRELRVQAAPKRLLARLSANPA
ncbi:MAG: hypothetical protein ACI4XG_25220, partial [Bradyrhizobium sp.]